MVEKYKDLLIQYSSPDARMTRTQAAPHAKEWVRAQSVIASSIETLQALQQNLVQMHVSWIHDCERMDSDELDALWAHHDKGISPFDVCRVAANIEPFCESVKHYLFDSSEDAVRAEMRVESTADRNTFLVNHVRRQQKNLFDLSWRILDHRAKMLDAERKHEAFGKLIEEGKIRKQQEETMLLRQPNAARPNAAAGFNRITAPKKRALDMFTSPATPDTSFMTSRDKQRDVTNLDRQVSEEFIGRFKTANMTATNLNGDTQLDSGYTEAELLEFTDDADDTDDERPPDERPPVLVKSTDKEWHGLGELPNFMKTDTFSVFKIAWTKAGYNVVDKTCPGENDL